MAVQAVFFDIGGVVVHANLEGYAEEAAPLFNTTPDHLRKEVRERVPLLEQGQVDSDTFWKQVGESLWAQGRGRLAEPGSTKGLWKKVMARAAQLDLKMLHLCWTLSRQKLVLGALSNTIEEHVEALQQLGAYQPFRLLLLSCRLGMRKPDPRIYKLAAKKAGVSLKACLLVDDLLDNVEAARKTGMQAHHYQGLGPLVEDLGRLKVL